MNMERHYTKVRDKLVDLRCPHCEGYFYKENLGSSLSYILQGRYQCMSCTMYFNTPTVTIFDIHSETYYPDEQRVRPNENELKNFMKWRVTTSTRLLKQEHHTNRPTPQIVKHIARLLLFTTPFLPLPTFLGAFITFFLHLEGHVPATLPITLASVCTLTSLWCALFNFAIEHKHRT